MKRLPTNQRTEPVGFEGLEARLLLAAAPLIQPDGPMPQAPGPACGPPVEDTSEAADADGDGKLGLNDVKTSAAPEPTSLTFNGRGIDLNEDAKVDALATAASVGAHSPDSTDIDMLLIGKVLSDRAEAQAARDGKITPWERAQLSSSDEPPVTLAYEPVWFSGAQAYLRGRVVDLAYWGADRTISAASYDFGPAGGGDEPAVPQERPILEIVLGSTGDYQSAGALQEPIAAQPDRSVCRYNLVAQVMGLSAGDGHRSFVVGYFEGWHYSAAEGPVNPDGVVIRMLGVHTDTSSADTDGFVQVPYIQEPGEKPATGDGPIVMDLGSWGADRTISAASYDFGATGADGIVFRMIGVDNDTAKAGVPAGAGAESHGDVGYEDGKLKLELHTEGDDIVFLVPEHNPSEQADAMADSLGSSATAGLASRPIIEDILGSTEDFETADGGQAPLASQAAAGHDDPDDMEVGADGTISYMIGVHSSTSDGGAGHCKIMAVRVANPEGASPGGGPLGAVMGGIGGILGRGVQPCGAESQGLGAGDYEVEIWFGSNG